MRSSIVIVSKDRKAELDKTLSIVKKMIDFSQDEILVFLDGCTDGSQELEARHPEVYFHSSATSLGASSARKKLYPHAKGTILIGFDDDAHPLNRDFITQTKAFFDQNPNLAIIAFEEIKGIYPSDEAALSHANLQKKEQPTGEFVGCGFAILKERYQATNGFPVWVDIYGEEACVAIEILDSGWDILYTNAIKVNHRVNKPDRLAKGKNYFRFGKQLKNETFFYVVYYPNPLKKILKLYWHNLKTYAFKDGKYFQIYISTIFRVLFALPGILKYRKPVGIKTIKKREALP